MIGYSSHPTVLCSAAKNTYILICHFDCHIRS